jgi:hypothetical protein
MARKLLQMRFIRSRRYTNYKGRKNAPEEDYKELPRCTDDHEKAICADTFFHTWKKEIAHPAYCALRTEWKS